MTTLRELQLAELQVLKAVAAASEELKITYFLNSGTLLGAVRHGGFIPWDDDVDICMPFEDYKRFLECGQQALGDRFFIQNFETDPNFHFSFTKVRMNGTTCLNSFQKEWDVHHGVCIDVFPVVPLTGKADFKRKHLLFTFCNFLQMENFLDSNLDVSRKELGSFFVSILKVFYFVFPLKLRVRWHKKILWWALSRKSEPCRSALNGNIVSFYPENVFSRTTKVKFEDSLFTAPEDWDQYLRCSYGDYMQLPPEEKRRAHCVDTIDLEHDYRDVLKKT